MGGVKLPPPPPSLNRVKKKIRLEFNNNELSNIFADKKYLFHRVRVQYFGLDNLPKQVEYINDQSNEIPSAKSVNFSYHFLPRKRGFKLAALNVNKLSTHIEELKILLGENPIDVLAINETKLDDSISDNEVYIPGYEIVRRDRTSGGGGGVFYYIRSSINFLYRADLNIPNLENLCIEVNKPRSKPFLIITW